VGGRIQLHIQKDSATPGSALFYRTEAGMCRHHPNNLVVWHTAVHFGKWSCKPKSVPARCQGHSLSHTAVILTYD
jgi:hypothetical protein